MGEREIIDKYFIDFWEESPPEMLLKELPSAIHSYNLPSEHEKASYYVCLLGKIILEEDLSVNTKLGTYEDGRKYWELVLGKRWFECIQMQGTETFIILEEAGLLEMVTDALSTIWECDNNVESIMKFVNPPLLDEDI